MPYDPTLPANNSPIVSAELRNQFAGLKALIDGLQPRLPAPVLDHDSANDADRLTLSRTLQPYTPDEWMGWKSDSGIGNPDTHPQEWNGPLGYDDDLSDDANWVINWNGFNSNNFFIVAYRFGPFRSSFSNVVHP
jgi:hypothetical protein